MTARASGAWVGLCSLAMFAASAEADPIPVLTVSVRDRGPTAAQVASVAGALGPEAQSGEALSRELLARFGRYAPQEDVLRPQREAIAAGETALFAQGRPAGRRRLQPALTAMEAAPDALELQENNRAAYLKGLFLMARIAHEDRRPEEAETWLRRAFAFDPWWMPSDYDCPLRFRPIVARLRPPSVASAPDASGTLSVRAPREGCTVSVDDARSPSTAQTVEQSLPARTHRVSLRCGEASRVRTVTVTAGRSTSLSLDPRLDALLRVAGLPGLNYPTAPESPAVVISDAAAVGSALGATRVVLLSGDRPMVVDVRRGELVHDEMSAQVERALGVGPGLPATVNQPPAWTLAWTSAPLPPRAAPAPAHGSSWARASPPSPRGVCSSTSEARRSTPSSASAPTATAATASRPRSRPLTTTRRSTPRSPSWRAASASPPSRAAPSGTRSPLAAPRAPPCASPRGPPPDRAASASTRNSEQGLRTARGLP
jgi:hypothetical protein